MPAIAEPAPRAGPKGRGRLWNAFKILLALVLIVFVLSKTDLNEMLLLLRQLSVPWLAISFVLFCALTLIKAYQYYLLTGRQAPYTRVLYVVIVQNAVSNFIAGGAGIASYLTMLSVDEGVRLRRVISSFIVVKVSDLLAVWVVLFTTSIAIWPYIPGLHAAVVLLLAAILLAVAVFVAAALLRQRFVSLVEMAFRTLRLEDISLVKRGLEMLKSFADQDEAAVRGVLRTSLLLSSLYMAVTLVWFYANLRAFSLTIPFVPVSFVNAFMQLISWVPIQVFGGLGVSETSLVYLFGVLGLPAAEMAAVGIGLRLILYGFTLLVLSYLPLSALLVPKARPIEESAGKHG